MNPLFGEYEIKIDVKGRFLFPSILLKLLPEDEKEHFVVKKGLDPCLVLYPLKVWEKELHKIYQTNQFIEKNRAFARLFQNGAVPVTMDQNNRILIPKKLLSQTKIEKEILLFGAYDRIEIWSQVAYQEWCNKNEFDLSQLSEEILQDK